jgi:5'-methylthioadenosine phosphorylase
MGIIGDEDTKLGLIIGSNKFNIDLLGSFEPHEIETTFGPAYFLKGVNNDLTVLPRHGSDNNIPPHMINHRANISGFQKLGINKILSFTSVGSLKLDLQPGQMLMPDDYMNWAQILTFFDTSIKHIIPGLDNEFRKSIYDDIKELPITIKFNGIYIQTQGPRLETKAEIQMMTNYGDVVGMTMASEATLAKELEIGYSNISVIDNFCNGLTEQPLSIQELNENQTKNSENISTILRKLLN